MTIAPLYTWSTITTPTYKCNTKKKQSTTMSASIELTMRRQKEYLHIILETEAEVIYYAKKYIKQGWEVYSIDRYKSIEIKYEYN